MFVVKGKMFTKCFNILLNDIYLHRQIEKCN